MADVPKQVHDWLSRNGKKGGRKGRATPPKDLTESEKKQWLEALGD